jgi:predicted metal-dependent peptidase
MQRTADLLSSVANKELSSYIMLKRSVSFVKINIHNNKSDIDKKRRNSETVAHLKINQYIHTFSVPNHLPNNLLEYFTEDLKHPV